MTKQILFGLAWIVMVSPYAHGVNITVDGKAREFWNHHSVVYAEVVSVTQLKPPYKGGIVDVTLDIKSTLTGPLDAAKFPRIVAPLNFGIAGTPISQPPNKKEQAIVVLFRDKKGKYGVLPWYFTFMPKKRGYVVVKGFDDPKVQQVIVALRELRKNMKNNRTKGKRREKVKDKSIVK